jgi:hypothetical protein
LDRAGKREKKKKWIRSASSERGMAEIERLGNDGNATSQGGAGSNNGSETVLPEFEETPALALRTGRMGDQVTPPARQRADLRELRTRGEGHTEKNFLIAEVKKDKIEIIQVEGIPRQTTWC